MTRSGWPPSPTTPRPYDVASLARCIGIDPADTRGLAQALGIGRRWVRRYRAVGLTERQADVWAARVGHHPAELWPTWLTDAFTDLPETAA